jgi:hypothetical protein
MSQFKVCTYHIKFDNANPIYEHIFNLSSKINKKYCELNGYEYTNSLFDESVFKDFLTDDFLKIDKKWTKACIYKYQYLLDVLNTSENDFIVYVEYDACFCNTIKKLEEYIDNEHSIFYSRCNWSYDVMRYINVFNQMGKFLEQNKNKLFDFYTCSDVLVSKEIKGMLQILSHPTFLNEGFYILKNNEISRKFLKCIIDYSPLFYEEPFESSWCAEGQVIGKLTSLSCFANHLKPLPPKTQGHIYGGSNRFNESECLVSHNSGIDKSLLYQKMEEISKNTYWQKYI